MPRQLTVDFSLCPDSHRLEFPLEHERSLGRAPEFAREAGQRLSGEPAQQVAVVEGPVHDRAETAIGRRPQQQRGTTDGRSTRLWVICMNLSV